MNAATVQPSEANFTTGSRALDIEHRIQSAICKVERAIRDGKPYQELEARVHQLKTEERKIMEQAQSEMFEFDGGKITPIAPPCQAHSETSREAAESILESCNRLQKEVYEVILSRGEHGATDDEIQVALEMNPSTQRPRRIELDKKGLIRSTETKRKTRTGRKATVWVAAGR